MTEKTNVTLIQGKDGQVKRVRVDGTEFSVLHAGPTVMQGQMGVTLTLVGVNVDAEMEVGEDNAA